MDKRTSYHSAKWCLAYKGKEGSPHTGQPRRMRRERKVKLLRARYRTTGENLEMYTTQPGSNRGPGKTIDSLERKCAVRQVRKPRLSSYDTKLAPILSTIWKSGINQVCAHTEKRARVARVQVIRFRHQRRRQDHQEETLLLC